MSTGTRSSLADRYFDGAVERQATFFDTIRNGNERYNRFARNLIEGVRQNSQDWTEAGRRWVTNPMDLVGLYESTSEALGNSQQRTLALAREWLDVTGDEYLGKDRKVGARILRFDAPRFY